MSTRFRWMCLGVLAVGLAVGGLYQPSVADDPKPADPKSTDKTNEPKSTGEKKSDKPAKLDQAELEKLFAEKLSNCALVGRFTSDGQEGSPNEDTYQITTAKKLRDDYWMFSGIKYGKKDIQIPLVIRVVWAGDTPMMAMDKFTIPGQGTYSFRLMFHGDRYAGSWQHDEHGGHMWGRLERVKPQGGKDAPKIEKKTEEKSGTEKKEGQAAAEPKAKIETRLQKLISVDFKNHMLFQTVNEIAKQTDVTIKIEGDELKSEGWTQNVKVTHKGTDVSGLSALIAIVSKYPGLVIIADDALDQAIVTSAKAAKARGQTPLTPKPASDK